MTLSIIIVNYNVKYFLEQCLHSIYNAIEGIETEIFVVDNNSVDGSCAMLKNLFPKCILIENKTNTGFSFANNQAIKKASGKYILLQNPDTVVQEDTYRKIIDFMEKHPEAGGLGVKMINGAGDFLPESKRSLPTPEVAFYKIFGLSALFPKSKRFGKYHLSYLDNNKIHSIEILSGAFLFMRKEALNKAGLLDEDFFMYGEDIDLSYRILKAGYKNFYFPETTIIHYKGESTKKGSINYVIVFYNAMIIFAKKHFSKSRSGIFAAIIKLAVWFRAIIAILRRLFHRLFFPVLDSLLIFIGFIFAQIFWEKFFFHTTNYYPSFYLNFIVPTYITIWVITIFYSGGYDSPLKMSRLLKGILKGTMVILLIYSLLNEKYRFSRAQILFGTLWFILCAFSTRLLFASKYFRFVKFENHQKKRIAIIGYKTEAERILNIISETGIQAELVGFISPKIASDSTSYIGEISQLADIIKVNKLSELIFCAKDISNQDIINSMLTLSAYEIEFKIAAPNSVSIIGSNSIDTAGEIYSISFNSISKAHNKRNKRLLDVLLAIIFLLFSPILLLFIFRPINFLRNCFSVLFKRKTWVGYCIHDDGDAKILPKIKPSVISIYVEVQPKTIIRKTAWQANLEYAKNYNVWKDLELVLKNIRKLGI